MATTPHAALVERLREMAKSLRWISLDSQPRDVAHPDTFTAWSEQSKQAADALSDLSWLRPVLEARLTDDVGRRCCSVIRGAQPLRVGWQGASR